MNPAVADSPIDPAVRLADARQRIMRAAREAGKDGAVIVAVSKTHPAETIERALAAGHCLFGENRVQEAAAKWPALRTRHDGVELHLVGPLQTNKLRDALALFDVIETLDREKLARAMADEIRTTGATVRLFVQVNTGEEPQKAGVAPQAADAFISLCRRELGLAVEGVMCIPPADEPPAPHFALLRAIADRNDLPHVSMGMSSDFETAVRLGATHVRLGTEIFGPRPSKDGN